MKDHCESEDNRPQGSEKTLKNPYYPSQGFCLFPSVKTCPINAPQRVFLGQVVSVYRGIGGGPDDSQNDSLPRRRPRRHRCTPRKSCSRTVSSCGEAAWLLDRGYDLLLPRRSLSVLESRGLLQGLRAIAQRSPKASTSVRRYQVRIGSQGSFPGRRMEYSSPIYPKAGKLRREEHQDYWLRSQRIHSLSYAIDQPRHALWK